MLIFVHPGRIGLITMPAANGGVQAIELGRRYSLNDADGYAFIATRMSGQVFLIGIYSDDQFIRSALVPCLNVAARGNCTLLMPKIALDLHPEKPIFPNGSLVEALLEDNLHMWHISLVPGGDLDEDKGGDNLIDIVSDGRVARTSRNRAASSLRFVVQNASWALLFRSAEVVRVYLWPNAWQSQGEIMATVLRIYKGELLPREWV